MTNNYTSRSFNLADFWVMVDRIGEIENDSAVLDLP